MEYQEGRKNMVNKNVGEAIDFPCPLELLKSCLMDKVKITTLSDTVLNKGKGNRFKTNSL